MKANIIKMHQGIQIYKWICYCMQIQPRVYGSLSPLSSLPFQEAPGSWRITYSQNVAKNLTPKHAHVILCLLHSMYKKGIFTVQ